MIFTGFVPRRVLFGGKFFKVYETTGGKVWATPSRSGPE